MSRARKIALVVIALLMVCISCWLVSLIFPTLPADERPAPTRTTGPVRISLPTPNLSPTAPVRALPLATLASSPTLAPTATITPTQTARPTALPTRAPTFTVAPTMAASPTSKPASTPTLVPTVAPTNLPAPAPCNCSVSDYDCKDFHSQREAQTCFDFCGGSAANNIWRLDGNDHDGKVCESLP